MEQSVQELCWLIQEALFETKHDFTISDPERLYHIAKENGLSGTVFEVIKDHGISQEIYAKFQKDFFKFVAQDEEQLRLITLIKGLLDSRNIKHVFLKGSTLKQIYPKTYMRAMGDIDFLVEEKNIKEVQELFQRVEIKLSSRNWIHDVYKTSSGMSIEVHSRLTKNKDEYPDLEDIQKIVANNQFHFELEILYLLYHIKKHLLTSGIGLRSIIDMGVYLNHFNSELNSKKLDRLLKENKMEVFFKNVVLFNERYLDTVLSDTLQIDQSFNQNLFESFTKYIVISGIHGIGISFNRFTGIVSNNRTAKFKRLRSLLKITFLPYNDLKYVYPKLVKNKMLLPLGWIVRLFDLLFMNRKRRRYRLKQIISTNMDESNISVLFDNLGV
jgi:hypothetical protein